MARKAREPIALRQKKLKDGRISLYLDTYVAASQKHSYEFLSLYLIPETNKADREKNRQTYEMAKAIQAQRLIDRARGKAGLPSQRSEHITLIDYCVEIYHRKLANKLAKSTAKGIYSLSLHLAEFSGYNTTISQIDKDYCLGFIRYLASADYIRISDKGIKTLGKISQNTASHYFTIFASLMNHAVRDGYLTANPTHLLSPDEKKSISYHNPHREYLTIEELHKMIDADCCNDDVKRAFLFACFTGLRISDISALRWSNIITDVNGGVVIRTTMQKTGEDIVIPLGASARAWLSEQGEPTDKVFNIPTGTAISYAINRWLESAGISKKVTFHTSRHTFATLLLTKGADIYTTSKLLGHQNIKTTQIYAEVVDKKKQDAINLLEGLSSPKDPE